MWLDAHRHRRHCIGLASSGVGLGDEVIVPTNTCVPTATGIRMVGARPVPVDIYPDTLMMDISQTKRAVSAKTKAIIPFIYGAPVDLNPLLALNIPIVEDCAQAHGCLYHAQGWNFRRSVLF